MFAECSNGLGLFCDELLQDTLHRFLDFRWCAQTCHPLLLGSCLSWLFGVRLFLPVAVVRWNCSMLGDSEALSWFLAPSAFTLFLYATTFALCSLLSCLRFLPQHLLHASTPPALLCTYLSVASRPATLLQDAVVDFEVPVLAGLVSHTLP